MDPADQKLKPASKEKHLFAIGMGKSGIPCSIGRVDRISELLSAIERNDSHGLKTYVRYMDLNQLTRVVRKMGD